MVVSNLSDILSDPVRLALIETVEKDLKTNKYDINLKLATKEGENFIGIVRRVTYNKTDDEKNTEKKRLILKTAPTNEARRKGFFSRPCFLREIYIYNEVLPFFKEFQESKGIISVENGFHEYAKCLGTIDVEPNECLLLDDLTTKDFVMIDRRKENITVDHVILIMKSLGKLHAISFALKDQQPEKFKEITSNLTEIFLSSNSSIVDYFEMMKQKLFDVISNEDDKHLKVKIEKLCEKSQFTIARECIAGELAEPYAVMCHGDCWTNNTLFKNDKNNKPSEVCLIDWQITRYASPVTDLLYYLFSCIPKELRDSHYDTFLKVYHESLSNHLTRLGSDPEKLFPYEAMLGQFKKFGKYGLLMANMLLPMLTSEEGNAPDLDEMAEQLEDGKLTENVFITNKSQALFNERLRGVIVDMVEKEYI